MKQIFKNKVMMGFILFMAVILFMSAEDTKKLEEQMDRSYDNIITMNIK